MVTASPLPPTVRDASALPVVTGRKWNVPASDISKQTVNPIRNVIENLVLTPNPDKPMIALSIGELVGCFPT